MEDTLKAPEFTVIYNGVKYVRVTNLKAKSFDLQNELGEDVVVPGVYFMVQGANHSWPDWMELEKFKACNMELNMEELGL